MADLNLSATDSLRIGTTERTNVRSNQLTVTDSIRIRINTEGATVRHNNDPFTRQVLIELNGKNNGWTDISSDVIFPVSCERGMTSGAVGDRVADAGHMSFTLNNSTTNSAHLNGYYSPDNANCRAGFGLGIAVQWRFLLGFSVIAKFTGRIESIKPVPGRYGIRVTRVTAVDYMDNLAKQNVSGIPTQTDKLASEIFSTIISSLGTDSPHATTVYPSVDVLPYALDNTQDEAISVMTELDKLAKSEYGYIYLMGDGTLVFESRAHRANNRTNIVNFTESQIAQLDLEYNRDRALNSVKVIIHPRRVDAANNTVLYAITTITRIEPGDSYTPFGPYRDPTQESARVGGIDMQTPVASTDYLMNSAEDGSGTDLTGSCSVTASFGGNGVSFTVTNTGSITGYLTRLQCRGRGLYDFDNVVLREQDDNLQRDVGQVEEVLDQPYSDSIRVASEIALYILQTQSQGIASVDRVGFFANSSALIEQAIFRDIGDRIGLNETMTGISTATTTTIVPGFHIQGVAYRDNGGGYVTVSWVLTPADNSAYWYLEVAGMSELNSTTILGFGLVLGHTDIPHGDIAHGDVAHADIAHTDTHTDNAHQDSGSHGDTAHTDSSHSDSSHTDGAHTDSAHSDVSHGDGSAHADDPHIDEDHIDDVFDDGAGPIHNDQPHIDEAHEDFNDHVDSAHQDVSHGDVAHSDVAHGDVAHGDIAHSDVTGHADVGHADIAHVDTAHSDSAHIDIAHTDTIHGDAN